YLPLTSGVAFTLALAADADLSARVYSVSRGSALSEIVAPWAVRPLALAGFTFTALGQGLFAAESRR
ncbi:MAG: hypothetical protein ACREJ3_02890, partial [Polyangiaceae bacterium]